MAKTPSRQRKPGKNVRSAPVLLLNERAALANLSAVPIIPNVNTLKKIKRSLGLAQNASKEKLWASARAADFFTAAIAIRNATSQFGENRGWRKAQPNQKNVRLAAQFWFTPKKIRSNAAAKNASIKEIMNKDIKEKTPRSRGFFFSRQFFKLKRRTKMRPLTRPEKLVKSKWRIKP